MTSKLKCPFCGEELYDNRAVSAVASRIDIYLCVNSKCGESDKLIGTKELWQALIQAKQDLEIARNALEEIKKHNKAMLSVLGEQIPKESTDTEEYCWWASCRIQNCLNALEKIEHKEI